MPNIHLFASTGTCLQFFHSSWSQQTLTLKYLCKKFHKAYSSCPRCWHLAITKSRVLCLFLVVFLTFSEPHQLWSSLGRRLSIARRWETGVSDAAAVVHRDSQWAGSDGCDGRSGNSLMLRDSIRKFFCLFWSNASAAFNSIF